MAVKFDHENLDAYQVALQMVAWADGQLRGAVPSLAAKDHLRRAAESIVRNIVRANSKRTSADRAKIFDVSYGSSLECAACLDVLCAWEVMEKGDAVIGKALLDRIVAMLIGLRAAKSLEVCESRGQYGVNAKVNERCFFAHEQLRVYQSALRFVHWCARLIRTKSIGLSRGRELDQHSTGVVLNIAEGNGKFSTADRKRFLQIAIGCGLQASSSLDIMAAKSVINSEVNQQGKEHLCEVVSMIKALARSLG